MEFVGGRSRDQVGESGVQLGEFRCGFPVEACLVSFLDAPGVVLQCPNERLYCFQFLVQRLLLGFQHGLRERTRALGRTRLAHPGLLDPQVCYIAKADRDRPLVPSQGRLGHYLLELILGVYLAGQNLTDRSLRSEQELTGSYLESRETNDLLGTAAAANPAVSRRAGVEDVVPGRAPA